MRSGDGALHVIRARRRIFGAPAELSPEHRAALDVFVTDLVRPYGLTPDVQTGQSYGDMAADLIAETVRPDEPVDLLVLAFAIPDMRPGRATATYLSHVCPGDPLAFAVCDQGTAAAFTALRLARDYREAERALVLIVEQADLPYDASVEGVVPQRHAGVALLCGRSGGGLRLQALEQHPNATPAQTAGVDGQPLTGPWWQFDPDTAAGEVVVAGYDPHLRYLCRASFTSTDVAGI